MTGPGHEFGINGVGQDFTVDQDTVAVKDDHSPKDTQMFLTCVARLRNFLFCPMGPSQSRATTSSVQVYLSLPADATPTFFASAAVPKCPMPATSSYFARVRASLFRSPVTRLTTKPSRSVVPILSLESPSEGASEKG